jgi:hypothetical protein
MVLAEHQAEDPAAALRWLLDRAFAISVHLAGPAARAIESLVTDENEHRTFLTALRAGYGYGFEVTDPGAGGHVDRPTAHRFTARQPRGRRTGDTAR